MPPQAEAITLGNTIFVRKRSCDDQGLMAHELVHVRQFKDLGRVHFLARYVGSYLRFRVSGYGHMASYRRIPLEVEASWVSRLLPMKQLEPNAAKRKGPQRNATAMRDRLARQRSSRMTRARLGARGGTWNRPRPPTDLKAVQAAMARRDATEPTSR